MNNTRSNAEEGHHRMNIAITSLYLPSGSKIGVGYSVHAFANALVARGHRVTVFSQSGACHDSLYDVQVVPVGRRFRTFRFAWNLRRYDWSRFDVLHSHGDDWFLWGCKIPRHIHTFHGSCLAEMLHANGFVAKLRMAALALCEFSACFLPDELVAVSRNTRRYNPFAKKVIANGVDLDTFRVGREKSPVPAVLFVGTMGGRKRGKLLLDIFQKEIAPAMPGAEFWAVCDEPIVGNGVRWYGRVTTQELAALYRCAWVFCLPSTYEGFGIPYIEAMASGTPVVATPNVGALEVTENGRYGIICDESELGRTLLHILGDPGKRTQLCRVGLERACEFGWDRICAEYEALYTKGSQPLVETVAG